MKYHLHNDTRARKVAKDLARIAKENGLDLPLTRAQQATARLLGYPDWSSMLAEVGAGSGPEDDQLSPSELAIRKARQAAALVTAGFGEDSAMAVLGKLRPTGRTGGAVSASSRVVGIQNYINYHPQRLREALESTTRQLNWNGYTVSLGEILESWADERQFVRLDREALVRDGAADLLSSLLHDVENSGHILDASAIAGEAPATLPDEGWEDMPDDPADLVSYYIHLGNHRFPSPFKEIGIDGCYVTIYEGDEAVPDHVAFVFTTGPEFERENDDVYYSDNALHALRSALRNIEVGFSPVDGKRLRDAHADAEPGYSEAWEPYLEAPLSAAWHCLKRYRSRSPEVHDALFVDAPEEDFAKLERAATERAAVSAMRKTAAETDCFPVRFIGRTPPHADDVYHEEMLASPYPRPDSGPREYGADFIASLFADMRECSPSWELYYMARKAVRVAEMLPQKDADGGRWLLRSQAILMQAAFDLGGEKTGEAAMAAEAILKSDLPERARFMAPAAVALLAAGMTDSAIEAAAAALAAEPGSPVSAWAAALVEASTRPEEAEDAIGRAMDAHGEVAEHVLKMDGWPWDWFFNDDPSPHIEPYSLPELAAVVVASSIRREGLLGLLGNRLAPLPG